jgi:hypothetical protein
VSFYFFDASFESAKYSNLREYSPLGATIANKLGSKLYPQKSRKKVTELSTSKTSILDLETLAISINLGMGFFSEIRAQASTARN